MSGAARSAGARAVPVRCLRRAARAVRCAPPTQRGTRPRRSTSSQGSAPAVRLAPPPVPRLAGAGAGRRLLRRRLRHRRLPRRGPRPRVRRPRHRLRRGQRRPRPERYGLQDVEALSLAAHRRPAARFDVVTLFEVIEHVEDPRGLPGRRAAAAASWRRGRPSAPRTVSARSTRCAKAICRPTTSPAGARRRSRRSSWGGFAVRTAGDVKPLARETCRPRCGRACGSGSHAGWSSARWPARGPAQRRAPGCSCVARTRRSLGRPAALAGGAAAARRGVGPGRAARGRAMRIAVHAKVLSEEQPTGIGIYIRHILRALARLDPADEFVLYSNQPLRQQIDAPNVRDRILRFPRLWSYLRLPLEFIGGRYDVLFVPEGAGAAALPAAHRAWSSTT